MPKFALQQVEMVLFKFGILQERFTDFIFPVSLEIECMMLLWNRWSVSIMTYAPRYKSIDKFSAFPYSDICLVLGSGMLGYMQKVHKRFQNYLCEI